MSAESSTTYLTSLDPNKALVFSKEHKKPVDEIKDTIGKRALSEFHHPIEERDSSNGGRIHYWRDIPDREPGELFTEFEIADIAVAKLEEERIRLEEKGLTSDHDQRLLDYLGDLKSVLVDVTARSSYESADKHAASYRNQSMRYNGVHDSLVQEAGDLEAKNDPLAKATREAAGYFLQVKNNIGNNDFRKVIEDHNSRIQRNAEQR